MAVAATPLAWYETANLPLLVADSINLPPEYLPWNAHRTKGVICLPGANNPPIANAAT